MQRTADDSGQVNDSSSTPRRWARSTLLSDQPDFSKSQSGF